ncbi:MAG: FecR domain-containing protein [Acidobacteria bacterium]|nr:FecR domain-containing protein [Acidobacteriota bacterium]MDA1237296.1 FecR domain-containing protein [Acidobacteriota bacterium]
MMFAKSIALCFVASAIAFGQADTGRPGTVFFVEGAVFLQDAVVTIDPDQLPEVRNAQRLRTDQGNAELLFAMGSFIRLGADSEIEMVEAGLTSATVRLHRGAMIVEAFRVWGGNSLKVLVDDHQIAVTDPGEIRVEIAEGAQPSVEVLKGSVTVTTADKDYKVKKKQSAALAAEGVQTAKIKALTADALTSWHEQRAKTVLAETPKNQRRKGGASAYDDGEKPFGLGDLPDRSQAGL